MSDDAIIAGRSTAAPSTPADSIPADVTNPRTSAFRGWWRRIRAALKLSQTRFQLLLGVLLTLLVVTVEYAGWLEPIEKRLYDWRALHWQRFTKPPTDRLLHIDITDRDVDRIGTWPWPRSVWGDIVDELRRGGAKVIGLDVLFDKPQGRVFEGQGTLPLTPGANQDELLSAAIARAKNVVSAASLRLEKPGPGPRGQRQLRDLLQGNLQLTQEQALAALSDAGVPPADAAARVRDDFITLRQQAMRARIRPELLAGDRGFDDLRRVLLPRDDAGGGGSSSLTPQLKVQYDQARTLLAIQRRFERSYEDGMPPAVEGGDGLLPALPITNALSGLGFVDYVVPPNDSVVRTVPLWAKHGNTLLPQFGLALACAMLDVSPRDLRLERDRVVIPAAADGTRGPIMIPVHTADFTEFGRVGYLMDVPWIGGPNWDTMYDFPAHQETRQHLPLDVIWSAAQARRSIEKNEATLELIVRDIKAAAREDASKPLPPVGDPAREVQALRFADVAEGISGGAGPLLDTAKTLRRLVETQSRLRARLDEVRQTVGGKAILLGWAITGGTDVFPTSVHAQCPGSVIHGAVFNAIMTGQFWRRPPGWVAPLTTFFVGLVATLLVAGLSPLRAMFAVALLILLFSGINDVLLFDYGNILLNAAGPLVAAGFVWSGVTLAGFMNEVAERGRITKRFRAYVDPTLVNYVLDNPERATFAGEEREMTVVFTDLQGFTSLSEVLRSGVVKLIAEYMELMVPVIRSHNGFVNKFLGDGIMFFFGAPQQNPNHATDALETVLAMQQLLERFNERLRDQDLPTLSMRAGVSTGQMFVGDAGPSFASEFTVLGDRVNLASRLESANKMTGTRNLVTARTLQRAGDRFLARPVAKLRVAGRTEPAVVYEVLCRKPEGGERERRLIEQSKRVFDAYQSEDRDACRAATEDMRREPITSAAATERFIRLYLDACAEARDPDDVWDGHITLGAK